MSDRPVTAQDYLDSQVEIARLRLTDKEREAVEWCIFQHATPQRIAVTLRGLLDRLAEVRY